MANAYALSGTNLTSFSTANPGVGTTTAITGLAMGDTLVGIDFRPQNGMLYGLGVGGGPAGSATLYAISTETGVATAIGSPIAFDVPIIGTNFGFDFNPTVDRIRVVTDTGMNFRINPNTGAAIDGNPMVAGIQPDGSINGATTTVDGTAYTNNQPNSTVTTLYTLSAATDQLFIQNPPNNGTQTVPLNVTLNGNPLNFTGVNGFDVAAGVNVTTSNSQASGSGLAALTVGGVTSLYSIDLMTGAATLVGPIVGGATPASGLAVQSDLGGIPAIGLSADGTQLVRFDAATPGTATTVAVTGIAPGETLAAIDFRPQTGQLYAFGVNDVANTATVYLVDPQTGALTIVGAAGQVAFVDAMGNPIDLPNPAVGYGMDFNPAVDRIRITTDTGLNFRINPNNGLPVDANAMVLGNQPDGAINGLPMGSTGVSAAAYTNSFGQPLMGGVTTLYTLDSTSNTLFIQNPPNNGTQTTGLGVTLGGNPLDFTSVGGFDIPAGVSVTANNAPATGFGYAALTVGGTSSLYRIDLATGAAINLGATGVALAGLTLAAAPAVAKNDAFTTDENTVVNGTDSVFTDNGFGADSDPNMALSVTAVNGNGAGVGSQITLASGALLTLNANGTFSYNPNGKFDFLPAAGSGASNLSATDTFSYTLNGGDTATVTITVTGVDSDDILRGTAGNDSLTGGAGGDLLNGGTGADIMRGGVGNDTYLVDNAGDNIIEFAGQGIDRILSSVSISMAVGGKVNVENLTLTGAGAIAGIGNALNNTIVGNNANNLINGLGGNDSLFGLGGIDFMFGGAGNDLLNGGLGADIMLGQLGNDTYVVDNPGDIVIEIAGQGIDRIVSSVSTSLSLTGRLAVENLALTGTAAIGVGNALGNVMAGNAVANRLVGLGGNDTMLGGSGNDILIGGLGKDTMTGGTGADDFDFNSVAEIGNGAGRSFIRDFVHLVDDIDLATIDANGSASGNAAFRFLAADGAAFTGVAGQLHWFQVNASGTANDRTIIEGDTDGNRVADFQIQLTGLKTLTAEDFVL